MTEAKLRSKRLKLYWVTTPDHDEDWFVIEYAKRDAERGHEDAEGYERGYATATLVCAVPASHQNTHPGWPNHELLEACGATFLRSDTPRVVVLGGQTYTEGMLEATVRQVDKMLATGEAPDFS